MASSSVSTWLSALDGWSVRALERHCVSSFFFLVERAPASFPGVGGNKMERLAVLPFFGASSVSAELL